MKIVSYKKADNINNNYAKAYKILIIYVSNSL